MPGEGARIRVHHFAASEPNQGQAFLERVGRRFPVTKPVPIIKAGLAGERRDWRGTWREALGPSVSFGEQVIEKARAVVVTLKGADGADYAFELLGAEDEVQRLLPQFDALLDGLRNLR
ncbi:MAG: hypothetical protein QM765_29205 [Myxococcales bacterium]